MSANRNNGFAVPAPVRALWRGEAPLGVVFWWHTMVVGTLINVATTLLFVALLSLGAPNALNLAAFLLPIPYNIFLLVAVWNSAERYAGPPLRAHLARLAVSLWATIACLA